MKRWMMAAALAVAASSAAASVPEPEQLVRQTTDEVISQLEARRGELQADRAKLYSLVDEHVLPHFDFERMARLVLGKYWRRASPGQQEQFIEQFRTLLVRTYATALFEYTGQEIAYKPTRMGKDDGEAVVRTEVVTGEGPNIPLDYSLYATDGGKWMVYDITVDGISLVTNYRSSYAGVIRRDGIDSLISALRKKNEELSQ